MNLPESSDKNLKKYFDEKEFVASTISQINKDLQGLYYGDFILIENTDQTILDQLISSLKPILLELSKRLPEQLSQFIYRVDLNEQKFMQSLSNDSTLSDLSYKIIEREAQKVYLRKKFS